MTLVTHFDLADFFYRYFWRVATVEPRFNKPLYKKVLGRTNNFLYPSNSKICGKEP